MLTIYSYPELKNGTLERHTGWEPQGGSGVYRRSLYIWRNFSRRSTACDLLVFLDGQNLFSTPGIHSVFHWNGEMRFHKWERPLLVVGVPASKRRYPEYVGWSFEPGHFSKSGARHADFLVHAVLPYIKSRFSRARLKGLIGASAGGVAALYTGWRYPRRFPMIGCLSAGRHYFGELLSQFEGLPAERIYLSCGDQGMDAGFLPDSKMFAAQLKQRGAELQTRWHRGDHSEPVWSRRIPDLLRFSLGEDDYKGAYGPKK